MMERVRVQVRQPPPEGGRWRHQAVMACARALGLPFADAAALIGAAPLELPRDLAPAEGERLVAELGEARVPALAVPSPEESLPCPHHPRLCIGAPCPRCAVPVCALCLARGGVCPPCARRARRSRAFTRARVAALLCVLVGVIAWGAREQLRKRARHAWKKTLAIDVVLLWRGDPQTEAGGLIADGLPRLREVLEGEYARYRPQSPLREPFAFTLLGPVPVDAAPPAPPRDGAWVARVRHFLALRRYLAEVRGRGHLTLTPGALHVYVLLEPLPTRTRFVEGFGADGGDLGVVRAAFDAGTVDQVLLAVAHESLHCLGASDKYDADGHALVPQGLAEPDLSPRYPQRYAEVMAGELPTDARDGRFITSLDELRIGPATAAEIGWTAAGRGTLTP